MSVREEPHEADRLLDRLLEEHGLRAAVARACGAAGAPELIPPTEYCLAVLARKRDPARATTYGLHPDDPDVRDRLDRWAEAIVANLRRWGPVYERIREEADEYTTTTLRGLVRITRPEDVIAVVADELSDVLLAGPPVDEMSLELARSHAPGGDDYVFQSPLRRWLLTTIRRNLPYDAEDIDRVRETVRPGDETDLGDALDALDAESDEAFAALVRTLTTAPGWRGDLDEALGSAARAEGGLADAEPAREHDRRLLTRVRASLVFTAEELQAERRSIPGMAAYVVLALRVSDRRQRIAILSLRADAIDPAASDVIDGAFRAALTDERQPTPDLLRRTREAASERVPRSRVTALEEVRGAGARRAAVLAPMARRLDELPTAVAGLDAIAAYEATSLTTVTTHRGNAAKELDAVHWAYGRLFKRYAMGRL